MQTKILREFLIPFPTERPLRISTGYYSLKADLR